MLITIAAPLVWRSISAGGSASSSVRLLVDGSQVDIDGADIRLSFSGRTGAVASRYSLEDGRFYFNQSAYGFCAIAFELNRNIWSEQSVRLDFLVQYFSAYARAVTELDIHIYVCTGQGYVRMVAGVEGDYRAGDSGTVSLETAYGRTISVSAMIPSP